MTGVLLLAALSGAVSYGLTGVVRKYALRNDVLDHPTERSAHITPTPRGGGLAIVASIALVLALGCASHLVRPRDAVALGVGVLVLGLIGWLDDHRGLSRRVRLAIHVAVGIWTVYMFGGMPTLRIGETLLALGTTGSVLAVIGVVWSINLYNFMDGIDGLAVSQAVLIFGAVAAMLLWRGDGSLGTIALSVATASAGFLAWNWPPAKVFLGDAGSGALGYLAAGLAVAAERDGTVPVFVFGILGGAFIADATVTLLRRLVRGERVWEAHDRHAYQRLARAWGSHRPVARAAIGATSVLIVVGAVALQSPAFLLASLVVAYLFLALLLIAVEHRAPM